MKHLHLSLCLALFSIKGLAANYALDFGNTDKINYDILSSATRILFNINKMSDTEITDDSNKRNNYIKQISRDFHDMAKIELSSQFDSLRSSRFYPDEKINFIESGEKIATTFFTVCFNPDFLRSEREAYDAQAKKLSLSLKVEAGDLAMQILGTSEDSTRKRFQLELLKKNITLLDAIRNNCLSNIRFPIISTLTKNELTVTEKLEAIFKELNKNGFSMPEIIFNKASKIWASYPPQK